MAIIGLLLADMKESDAPLAAYTLVSAWKNSYADGPITNLIKGTVGDFNPPMYSSAKKLYRNFKKSIYSLVFRISGCYYLSSIRRFCIFAGLRGCDYSVFSFTLLYQMHLSFFIRDQQTGRFARFP